MQCLPLNFVKVYESLTILCVWFIHDGDCWICIALLFEQQSIHVYCCCWSCVFLHIVFSTIVLTCTPGSMMSWSSCVQHITQCASHAAHHTMCNSCTCSSKWAVDNKLFNVLSASMIFHDVHVVWSWLMCMCCAHNWWAQIKHNWWANRKHNAAHAHEYACAVGSHVQS